MNIFLFIVDFFKEWFGIFLKILFVYCVVLVCNDFYWICKDFKLNGSINILVYEVLLNVIGWDSSIIGDIIKVRDIIGFGYLLVEDDDLFVIEEVFVFYFFIIEIDGKFVYEIKGMWEVKDNFMVGLFFNYVIKDEKNNWFLIIEGFMYVFFMEKWDF